MRAMSTNGLLLLSLAGSTSAYMPPLYASAPLKNTPSSTATTLMSAPTATTSSEEIAELSSLTVVQLKDLLRKKALKVSGRKSELILRLAQAPPQSPTNQPPKAKKAFVNNDVATKNGFPQNQQPKAKKAIANNDVATKNGFQKINVPARLVARLADMGITNPTPIQKEAIPKAIVGQDILGLAQTGTGKTLAFGVPLVAQMLNNNSRPRRGAVRGLVLAPTRELANQIAVELRSLTEGTRVETMVVVGGKNIQTQTNKLKSGTDLLVATPGRLLDLMDRRALTLSDTSFLVLDEADMMLDMGFLPSLRKVVKMLPPKRQTMLFSATMSKSMNEVARSYLKNPVRVEVARAGKTADKIIQKLHYVAKLDKGKKLISLLRDHQNDRALVFGRTKHGMEKLSKKLIKAGFKAGSIHGNKSQPQRDKAIAAFKSGSIKVLVATDVAARGLDIPDVKHVYNYELPNVPEAYVHRIGRTARAGKDGAAVAFCSMEEMSDLMGIQQVIGCTIPVVSGSPWSRTAARNAKNDIMANKEKNDQIRAAAKKNKNKKKSSHGPSLTKYSRR